MIYTEDLDAMAAAGCQTEGCDHRGEPVFLHAKCHVGGRIEAMYLEGVLHVRCLECSKPIVEIVVARKDGGPT